MESINSIENLASNKIRTYRSKSSIHPQLFPKTIKQNEILFQRKENEVETSSQPNEKNPKIQEIIKILDDAFETPSTKSIVKIIFTPHLLLKIFLFTFLFAATGYSSYLVFQSIMDYLTYGVTTTSRTFYETPTLFPKVTFCNLNPFTTQYAWNLTQQGIGDGSFLSIEEKKMTGHDIKDILFDCKYNTEDCNSTSFTWSYDEWYGNCYSFNGHETNVQQTSMTGSLYGLRLILYVNFYEAFIGSVSVDTLGVVVRIENSSYFTYFCVGDGVMVAPGTEINILVDREFKSMLAKPYSNCEIDSYSLQYIQGLDLYNLIVNSGYKYTQQLCFYQCWQNFLIDKHNFTDSAFLSLFNETYCSPDVTLLILDSNEVFDSAFINENCIPSCPLECDQNVYKASSSSCQISGYAYQPDIEFNLNLARDFINRTLDLQTVRESIVGINVFYNSLSYTLTTESPQWDAISLLGSIGGNLGLFLGVSVFSISELIALVIEIIFILKK